MRRMFVALAAMLTLSGLTAVSVAVCAGVLP